MKEGLRLSVHTLFPRAYFLRRQQAVTMVLEVTLAAITLLAGHKWVHDFPIDASNGKYMNFEDYEQPLGIALTCYATPHDANIGKIWVPVESWNPPAMLKLSMIPLYKVGNDYFGDMNHSAPTTVKWISQQYIGSYHDIEVDVAFRNGVGPTNNADGVCFGFHLVTTTDDWLQGGYIYTVPDEYNGSFGEVGWNHLYTGELSDAFDGSNNNKLQNSQWNPLPIRVSAVLPQSVV
jgi:hypothetical protein